MFIGPKSTNKIAKRVPKIIFLHKIMPIWHKNKKKCVSLHHNY